MKSQNKPYPDRVNRQFKTTNEMIKHLLIINLKNIEDFQIKKNKNYPLIDQTKTIK